MSAILALLPENWEAELESGLLKIQNDSGLTRAYICSPCKSDTPDGVLLNMKAARFYMRYASQYLHVLARAPHAYLPVLLCDQSSVERSLALHFGQMFLEMNDELLVCGSRLSPGMRHEIESAARMGIPIRLFHKELYKDIQKIVSSSGAQKQVLILDEEHPSLSMNAEMLFCGKEA